ncbi:hypothetical protein AB0O76_05885 [Streptomyces sp. NPDC086554]|uniref:hypothetical protein n=1 Tax=Streptomyces sp. NPDC086554 TaxID=3154864 RepID=UPI003438219D
MKEAMNIKRTSFLSVAGALLLAGCAQDSDSSSGREPDADIARRTDARGLAFPLDGYRNSTDEERALDQAIDMLSANCMRKYGLEYDVASGSNPEGIPERRPYGVTDEGDARQYGYRHPGAAKPQPKSEVPTTKEEDEVLLGQVKEHEGIPVPRGGCLRKSSRKILANGPKGVDMRLADNLILEASDQARNDSRVRSVFRKWSSCMKDKGFSYETPVNVMDGRGEGDSEVVSTREKNLAVADVKCKKKGNVVGVWSSVEIAYQRKEVEENATALSEVKAKLKKQVSAANRVLSGQVDN